VKILHTAGKLVENDSFKLVKTAAVETVCTFRSICKNFLKIWIVLFEFIVKDSIHFRGGI